MQTSEIALIKGCKGRGESKGEGGMTSGRRTSVNTAKTALLREFIAELEFLGMSLILAHATRKANYFSAPRNMDIIHMRG